MRNVMRHCLSHPLVALLTFVVGISTAMLWLTVNRHSSENLASVSEVSGERIPVPQNTNQRNVDPDRAWESFFPTFRDAVRRRDREALKEMMIPEFFYSGGGGCDDGDCRDEAFEFWDDPHVRGWRAFDRILAEGAVPQAAWWDAGRNREHPSRVAPRAANSRRNIDAGIIEWYAIFEFREDGRWYCTIFNQCCD